MGVTIEYNRIIYKDNKTYYVLIKEGPDNVYEPNSTLRSKSWKMLCVGTHADVWKRLGVRAGLTESRSLMGCPLL